MSYNHLSEPEKILSIIDRMGAVSPETGVTAEQMVAKGIELGMTKDVFTEHWHGHENGDHPWWMLLASMCGVGSEEEVAKHNVPHLHRQKVKMVKNGRKTNVMVYWYDETKTHEVTYTGKAYKEKMMRKKDIQDLLDRTRNLPKTKEERVEQMRKDPNYIEIDGHFYLTKFVVAHPEKFNPVFVAQAMSNVKEA